MKLYIYRGLDGENVPKDVTRVIVDENVTIIKIKAFCGCKHLVSIIMGDNVKRIGGSAFEYCHALRFVRFSKILEYIGAAAFRWCESLEALFLPSTIESTVKSIGTQAFSFCPSLRLIILPNGVHLSNLGDGIIEKTAISQIAETAGAKYEYENDDMGYYTTESNLVVSEWLIHHMNNEPFHKLCYDPSITTLRINDYLNENGNESALQIDSIHGSAPLHMLSMNPHAPPDSIAALLDSNMDAVFVLDKEQKTPLDYAREYNVGGLVGMITSLCNHRNSLIDVGTDSKNHRESGMKRRRIG